MSDLVFFIHSPGCLSFWTFDSIFLQILTMYIEIFSKLIRKIRKQKLEKMMKILKVTLAILCLSLIAEAKDEVKLSLFLEEQ